MAARSKSLVVEKDRVISQLKEKVFVLDGCLCVGLINYVDLQI